MRAEVVLGGARVKAEVAKSFWKKAKGLMFRESLAEGGGMLFVFGRPSVLRFWMLFMRFPIDIVFLDGNADGVLRVVKVHHSAKPTLNPFGKAYSSETPAKYAVELPAGFCRRQKVREGSRFSWQVIDS